MDFMVYTFLAQAYSCDSYGGSAYGECAVTPTPEPTPSDDGTTTYTTSTTTPLASSTDEATSSSSTTTDKKQGTTQQQTTTQTTPQAEIASTGIGWDAVFMWSFLGALLIAIIIFLWRRFKRNRLSTFDNGQF